MSKKSTGLQFHDPTEQTTINYIMTGFVDDTTHWINSFSQALQGLQSIPTLYKDTQQTAQWWEQLLHATGGKLELQKCFYYPIIWIFDEEGTPTLSDEENNRELVIISSENGQSVQIKKKSPTISHKTLGIMENPSGDYSEEYNSLQDKAQHWRMSITNQYLTRSESKIFHQSFFLPSMRYHLTVGTFTDQQLLTIHHPIIQTLLPRMGYNANMPKPVVYGPIPTGVMGFQSLMILQGSQKIKHLLQAYRHKSSLYRIIHTTFSWAQLVTGTSIQIFQDNTTQLPMLDKERWIQTLRHYLHHSRLQLHIPGLKCSERQRDNDVVLMDYAIKDSNITYQDTLYILSLIHI